MDIWTEEDERNLQAMQKRKKETQETQSEELLQVIKRHVPINSGTVSSVSIYDLRKAMIAHGGEFRDALKPFDHMGRPTAVAAPPSMWHDHTTVGMRPLASDVVVEVVMRHGDHSIGTVASFDWSECGKSTIVQYRVAE